MESTCESKIGLNNIAHVACNSQLIEDSCEVPVSLTDESNLSQDWQKLRAHNFLYFSEDDVISNRNLSKKLPNSDRSFENLECQTLNCKPDHDKIFNFQDLIRSDCDILSLCKNYQEKDDDNSDDMNPVRNKKYDWAFSQDSLLPNVQEWLFNVATDKKKNHFQANSICEMNNAIAGLQSIGNFNNSYNCPTVKTPTLIQGVLKSDLYKNSNKDLNDFYINSNISVHERNGDSIDSGDSNSGSKTIDYSSIHSKYASEKTNNKEQSNISNLRNLLIKNCPLSEPNEDDLRYPTNDSLSIIGIENNYNLKILDSEKKITSSDNTSKSLNGNIKVKPIKVLSKKKPILFNLSSEKISNHEYDKKKKPSLAMVTFTQDYNTETIKVTIISSNKKQTVFKINAKDVVQAVSAIKESSLQCLGLKSEQLLIIATTANKQFQSNLQLAMDKLSDKTSEIANLSITHHIDEDLSIAKLPNIATDKASSANIIKIDTNLGNEVKHQTKTCKVNLNKESVTNARKRSSSDSNTKMQRNLASNVGFSLLAGSSPTMVSRPSVLDSLTVSDESKRSLVSENKLLKFLEELGITLDSLEFCSGPHEKKSWRCPINNCLKSFGVLYKLKVHILSHDGIRPYKCSYENCDWSFCTRYKLKRHMETHLKRKDFVCSKLSCNKKFTTIYNLNTHMQLHQKPKVCVCTYPDCNSAFESQKELEKHMYHHDGHRHPYRCKVDACMKGFFTPNSLALHSRSHHNDEDLKCKWEGCCKKFDKPSRLKMHMRSHTGVRPYACRFKDCSSKFNCASKLSRHQKRHTNDRKHTCSVCKKAFLRSEHLKGHLLTHSGVRNFQCPIPSCDANFTAKSSLYVHVKKHKTPKTDGKNRNVDRNSCKTTTEENRTCSTPFFGSECQQLDYITLIEDKELSSDSHFQNGGKFPSFGTVVPLTFQHDQVPRSHEKQLHTLNSQDAVLMQFLDVSSGMALPLEAQESTISLTVSDSLFPPTMTLADDQSHLALDLGFLDVHQKDPRELAAGDFKRKGYSANCSSRTTDVVNGFSFSQKSKQRNGRGFSRYQEDSPLKADFGTNDVILSDIVNDHSKLQSSLQDDSTNVFYSDSLITEDILNYPPQQSTINLRDLE